MRLDRIIAERGQTLSFEFFPAKTPKAQAAFEATVTTLAELGPDCMTVTYGAGGGTRAFTLEALRFIAQQVGLPVVSHLTCVGSTRAELRALFDDYHAAGVHNFLALRGDPPKGQSDWQPTPGGCLYASELIELIREDGRFGIACAAFPEGHPESASREQDWQNLANKFSAGASMAMTQAFFDARYYRDMLSWFDQHTGSIPHIVPGIMPLPSWTWAVDFVERFCPNTTLPESLRDALAPLDDDAEASAAAGLEYVIDLCRDLLEAGAPGLHLYTMNKPESVTAIVTRLRQEGLLQQAAAAS